MPCFPFPLVHYRCDFPKLERVKMGKSFSDMIACLGNSSGRFYLNENIWRCDAEKDDFPNCHSSLPSTTDALRMFSQLDKDYAFIIRSSKVSGTSLTSLIIRDTSVRESIYSKSNCSEDDVIANLAGVDKCEWLRGFSSWSNDSDSSLVMSENTWVKPNIWLTKIGLGVSLASMTITLTMFLLIPGSQYHWRPQFHLIVALMGFNLLFLIRDEFGSSICKFTAMALHFFLLACFFWTS